MIVIVISVKFRRVRDMTVVLKTIMLCDGETTERE